MKELRQYGAPDHFKVRPGLFSEADRFVSYDDFFMYCKEELAGLASRDELSLTEIHNLPSRIRDACGMIILGQEFEYGSSPKKMVINPDATPEVVKNYKVKLRSLDGSTIKWKKGKEISGSRQFRAGSCPQSEDVWIDTEQTECELTCAQAWKVLHQHGKYCRMANRDDLKAKYWKYEELSRGTVETPTVNKPKKQIVTQHQASL